MALVWDNLIGLLGFNPSGDLGPYTIYTNKRGLPVWFLKAPPRQPPSLLQRLNRSRFQAAAWLWVNTPFAERLAWNNAARLAGLTITGYNLFTYYVHTADVDAIKTVERNSGIPLL